MIALGLTTPPPAVPMPTSARPLIRAMQARGLSEHGLNVAVLAAAVCRRLGLGTAPARTVTRAAFFHDVGKLWIAPSLLDRRGSLDARASALLRRHPAFGERMLRRAAGLEGLAPLVRSSHERWDGTGYPDGLRGDRIPLGARIIAICDTWDAMRSDRPYRAALGFRDAVDVLLAEGGRQFDDSLVAVVLTTLSQDGLS